MNNKTMQFKITHTHGTTETHSEWQAAHAALVSVYGDGVYVIGDDGREADEVCAPSLESGRGLAWSAEEDSEGDDGVRAVAKITAVY